ncbi:MAG TPA: dephospho-CoA kinase [Acidimicrobiia bacterium]
MKFVALSGGIGTGKSTVASMFVERGAHVIDADALSRDLQQPGQPLFDRIVARWGAGVLDCDGRLDRPALGRIVFADREELAELTAMAGPITERELVRRARLHVGTGDVVVAEAAMYLGPLYGMNGLIVVDAPAEVAVTRLVERRGMPPEDARARIASQLPREARLEHADLVIDNAGPIEDLEPQVARAWEWVRGRPDATPRLAPR